MRTAGRLWVATELYYPEETSTGYYLTGLAEGLARKRSVSVFCAPPNYSQKGTRVPRQEIRNGVSIRRCASTVFDKNHLFLRTLNALSFSASIAWSALWNFRSGDIVLMVTNPPLMPFIVGAIAWCRGARRILLIHDVYPEVLVAAGLIPANGLLAKIARWATSRLYRGMDRIVVLGRDMEDLVANKAGGRDRIRIIPNWSDVDLMRPLPRVENEILVRAALGDRFVVQYAGNMGRTHGIDTLLAAARQLAENHFVHFLLSGSGAKRPWLLAALHEHHLKNVTVLEHQPRDQLNLLLNASDIALISLKANMTGVSVPSRLYNIMAAGKPILAVADENSELARVIREEGIGFVVPPENPESLVQAIQAAQNQPEQLAAMGARARAAALAHYRFESILQRYEALMEEMDIAPARR